MIKCSESSWYFIRICPGGWLFNNKHILTLINNPIKYLLHCRIRTRIPEPTQRLHNFLTVSSSAAFESSAPSSSVLIRVLFLWFVLMLSTACRSLVVYDETVWRIKKARQNQWYDTSIHNTHERKVRGKIVDSSDHAEKKCYVMLLRCYSIYRWSGDSSIIRYFHYTDDMSHVRIYKVGIFCHVHV